jgi:mannose-1-phosphate guanylyltransferase / mannose-6-phosphate isomerase
MYCVILCGGSGNRLWPLSRKNFPKQFLSLYSDKSLLQETFMRMLKLMPSENIFFITNKENYFNVFNQIKDIQKNVSIDNIMTEPLSLNTAPAIAYAVKYLEEQIKINSDSPIIFLPSDHYIGSTESFVSTIKKAMERVNGFIGTIGIVPNKPETGYGYIRKGARMADYSQVLEYKEKPDSETAKKYLETGEYLWNSGMYLFNVNTFTKELSEHAPEIYNIYRHGIDEMNKNFEQMPNISIDYAISEKSKNVVVFDGDFDWNDIGSFDSLAEITKDSGSAPNQVSIDSRNVFVHSASNKLIATLGMDDVIIIESKDSILVQKKGYSEDVKKIVNHLKEHQLKELEHNMVVYRPWGKYEILIDDTRHKVKKITVYPGAKLSLQAHYHRAEHWVVIQGFARVVNGDNTILLRENESTYIPSYTMHRLENPGMINLELIEVQTGNYLEEDDIIRFDDEYNRI